MATQEKDTFILRLDFYPQIKMLSAEQRGNLMLAIFAYQVGDELPDMDMLTQMCFSFIRASLDAYRDKYKARCDKNRENGNKGGRPPKNSETEKTERFSDDSQENPAVYEKTDEKAQKPNGFFGNPSEYDSDSDSESEYDSDSDFSLSPSPSHEVAEEMGGVTPAERENFLKILFFEKKLISPQNELTRFLRHYEKSGWVDANGNKIRSKTAALGAWRPDKDAVKCPDKVVAVWQEVYAAASRASPGTDCTPLLTLFRGIQLDGSSIHILAADKALMDFIEHPARIEPIGAVIRGHFGANKRINYRIPRQ